MPTLPLLMAEIDIEGLAARVDLNGVSVFRSEGGRDLRQNRRLNGWALMSGNVVEVSLARLRPGTASFSIDLRIVQPGQSPDEPAPIASYHWNEAADPLTPGLRRVFQSPIAFGAPRQWSWTLATPGDLTGVDRTRIDELLRRLRRTLVDRRPDEAIELQAIQLEEMAVAVGDDPGRYRDQYAAFLAGFLADPSFRVEDYDSAELRLEPMAGGRIVHATQGGQSAIRAGTSERAMALDPYLSRIGGRWTIVR